MSTLQKLQGELLILPRRIYRGWPWLKVRPGHGGASHTGVSHMGETSWTRPLRSEVTLSREGSGEKGPRASEAGGAENGRVFCDFPLLATATAPSRASGPALRPTPGSPRLSPQPEALGQRWGAPGRQGPCTLTPGFAPTARPGRRSASEATCTAVCPAPASGPGLGQLCDKQQAVLCHQAQTEVFPASPS